MQQAEDLLPLDVWDAVIDQLACYAARATTLDRAKDAATSLDALSRVSKTFWQLARPAFAYARERAATVGGPRSRRRTSFTQRAVDLGDVEELRFGLWSIRRYHLRFFGANSCPKFGFRLCGAAKRAIFERNEALFRLLTEHQPSLLDQHPSLCCLVAGMGWIAGLEEFARLENSHWWLTVAADFARNLETAKWFLDRGFCQTWKSLTKFVETDDPATLELACAAAFGDDVSKVPTGTCFPIVRKSLHGGHRRSFRWILAKMQEGVRARKKEAGDFEKFRKVTFLAFDRLVAIASRSGCLDELTSTVLAHGASDMERIAMISVPGPRTPRDWEWCRGGTPPESYRRLDGDWTRSFFLNCCRFGSIEAMRAVLRDSPDLDVQNFEWEACLASDRPETLAILAERKPLDERTANRVWFSALHRASAPMLREFYRLFRPDRHESQTFLRSSWLEIVARRSPWTRENSGRSNPPIVPILDLLLEVRGPSLLNDAEPATFCCAKSDNSVALIWLLDRGVRVKPRRLITEFYDCNAPSCLEVAFSRHSADPESALDRVAIECLKCRVPPFGSKMDRTVRAYLDRVGSADVFRELQRHFTRRVPLDNAEIASSLHFEEYIADRIKTLDHSLVCKGNEP